MHWFIAAALLTIASAASAAPRYIDLTRTAAARPSDLRGIEERTRQYEALREAHAARTTPVLAAVTAQALDQLQASVGPRPSLWQRLAFPGAPSMEEGARWTGALAELRQLSESLEKSAASMRAHLLGVERSLDSGAGGPMRERLELRRRQLDVRVQHARDEIAGILDALDDRAGGFGARLHAWGRQFVGRDPATRLANLRSTLTSWGVSMPPPTLGAELTYSVPAPSQAKPPTGAITPAYLTAGALDAPEDLSERREVELSEEIRAKAAELATPAAALGYVKDRFRYEWYYGSLKGSTETLREGSGNDVDLATLLIALLRAQGISARYVHGTIQLPLDQVASLAGLLERPDDPSAAPAPLSAAVRDAALKVVVASGIPYEPVVAGGAVTALRLTHVWVEAYLPYGEYRGVPAGPASRQWVPMDPAIGGRPLRFARAPLVDAPGEMNLDPDAFTSEYVVEGRGISPLELFRAKVDETLAGSHPGTSYTDARRQLTIEPEGVPFIPGALPYTVAAVHGEFASVPDTLRQRSRIRVEDEAGLLLDVTIPLHRLVAHRAALTFAPATDADLQLIVASGGIFDAPASVVELTPCFRIDGKDETCSTRSAGAGAPLRWSVELLLADGSSRRVENRTVAGNVVAMGFGAPRNLYVEAPLFANGDLDSEATRLLYAQAARYATAWSDAENELSEVLQVIPVRPTANVVFVESQIEVAEVLGVRQKLVFKGLEVDADLRNVVPVELAAGRSRALLRISGLEGSFQEAKVLSDAIQVPAISAVGVLQQATERGVDVLRITPANVATELPRLTSSGEVVSDVIEHVASGRTVLIPISELTVEDWTGTGYVVIDPQRGDGGYFLSGRVSGGKTIVSPYRWALEAIIGWMRNPYTQPATTGAGKVTAIAKLESSDLPRVVVGSVGKVPLRVFVLGEWKDNQRHTLSAPVKGVTVDFYRCNGQGDAQHPACGIAGTGAAAFSASTTSLQNLLQGSPETVKVAVQAPANWMASAVTDDTGYATVWVTPDPAIEKYSVFDRQPGLPEPQLLGLNQIMAVVNVRRGDEVYPVILRSPFTVLGEPDVPTKLDGPMAWQRGVAGVELPDLFAVRVLDRFGNPRANEWIEWTSGPGGGRFVDPELAETGSGPTAGLQPRLLDTVGTAPEQKPSLSLTSHTQLPLTVSFIPGYGAGGSYETTVKATLLAGGLSRTFPVSVSGTQQYVFALGSKRDAWFGGIRGTRYAWPLVAMVYARTSMGWVPATSGVTIRQSTWDEASPGQVTTSAPYTPGADGRAVLWPTYDLADAWQRFRWEAEVTNASGTVVKCDEIYGARVWSGIVKVSFARVDRSSAVLPLPGNEPARPYDQTLNVTLNNPTERSIFVRVTQSSKVLATWAPDSQAPDSRSLTVPGNGVGGSGAVDGNQQFTLRLPVEAAPATAPNGFRGGTATFAVLAPDWDPAGVSTIRLLTSASVTYQGGSDRVPFAGRLDCTYVISPPEFSCEQWDPASAASVTVVAPIRSPDVYSGTKGAAQNNVSCVYANSRGPVPPGRYAMAEVTMGPLGGTGPLSNVLTPLKGTDTCGRSGFVIHGGQFDPNKSSEGCIILKPAALQTVNEYGGGVLKVVACKPGTACTPEVCDRNPSLCLPNGVPLVYSPAYVPAGSGSNCHLVPASCYSTP